MVLGADLAHHPLTGAACSLPRVLASILCIQAVYIHGHVFADIALRRRLSHLYFSGRVGRVGNRCLGRDTSDRAP